MQNKIYNIQALRGIAVLLVVFYHIIAIETKYNSNYIVMPDFFKIGNIGVDIFFIISGFIMVTVTKNYFKDRNKFYKFIYLRFTRIYPLYWFYTILLLPILFIKPEWVNSSQNGNVNILSSILLFPTETLPLVMVGWSLIHEIYFYIIFGLFLLLIDKSKLIKYTFIWLLLIIISNILIDYNLPLIKLIINPLTVEFIAGILLGIYFLKYNHKISFSKTLLFISFLSLLFISYLHESVEIQGWSRIMIYGVPSFLIVLFSIEVEKQGFVFHKYLILIGDASYSIYLSHLLTLNVVAKVFNIFLFENYIFELLMVTTMLTVALAWGLISYRYIETPIINFTKKVYKEKC